MITELPEPFLERIVADIETVIAAAAGLACCFTDDEEEEKCPETQI